MQLQAAFAHFLGLVMVPSSRGMPRGIHRTDLVGFDAGLLKRDAAGTAVPRGFRDKLEGRSMQLSANHV
jgi:hypothetical protein